jgi:hypothetical protein
VLGGSWSRRLNPLGNSLFKDSCEEVWKASCEADKEAHAYLSPQSDVKSGDTSFSAPQAGYERIIHAPVH